MYEFIQHVTFNFSLYMVLYFIYFLEKEFHKSADIS
jgi:hypothetical protein